MIILDIAAPIMLMFGLKYTTSGNASLLNNFEIVATSIIALFIFKEVITKKLWIGILLVTISSAILTIDVSSFTFSWGSLLIIGAAICWGFENNCTRKISDKSTYEIVTIKGLSCGAASIIIALIIGERFPNWMYLLFALLLGFVAYGLSIFFYIKAQNKLGAAKTSSLYAINPFVAVVIAFIIFIDYPQWNFYCALAIMIIATIIIIIDTLEKVHKHLHIHTITHTHDGSTHTHVIEHDHTHAHYTDNEEHNHHHNEEELLKEINHEEK